MKKIYPLLAMMFVALSISLTSCDDDYYGPPGSSYDPDLIGTWELYSADGVRVYGYQVNWLEFRNSGRGAYYYYHNAQQYSMGLTYSIDWYGGSSQLYISYADGRYASMDYWFNSNASYLYTQWYEAGYRHTYVYQYVGSPYADSPSFEMPAQQTDNTQLRILRPGLSYNDTVIPTEP